MAVPGHNPSGPGAPDRVLIRGVNWLGDAVMTTPALQRLREALPKARLTLLTHEKLATLWQNHPSLDDLLAFSAGESPWSVARRLRAGAFQSALLLPNSPRAALEVWLARIPRRIGYARPWRNWLLTHPLAPRPGQALMPKRSASEVKRLVRLPLDRRPAAGAPAPSRTLHQVHDYLHLAAALGANPAPLPPLLEITAAEMRQAQDAFLSEWRDKPRGSASAAPGLFLGLTPGAEYGPAKRWPVESFAAVARAVSRQVGNSLWLLFGGSRDWQVCDEIARRADIHMLNLAGKTSLRQLMALLKLCRVVLTNDSGPMHVAAALGTPVIVPFGSTSPELTGPGLPGDPRHRLLQSGAPCAPCFRRTCPIDFRCMTGISPDRVTQAILQVLALQ
ncbi:MAG TPA: lipopolysaccharide heptosyltransferase II [Verrucomicrobiota bacterium]|nr:lipopolysaccharide heptosyltransferase II [Verrucomicrobiota bacterium]HQL77562.1 lipopolysaccharide heptosyltransferase II [Verrucomicrobiota bacterium]